ncbi:cyclic lactone autoinducer peptide [Lactiplantibacillus dongliensis]|uniref:Cyclic lactone autoinducer peptide n=1 Tax=Lactiplantibacillus dongliensis TaxID=2559919 RepID=A0ABW1R7F9_9LACO|nr:cyclic lactone autoinducer peptide [Lactiplantibacillus dongliensis]
MKAKLVKFFISFFRRIGRKQLVMNCVGLAFEPKIPEDLKRND